jgi:hypothetical protein
LNIVDKYFGFLSSEYEFKGPYEFFWNHELHVNYIKGRLIVDINFNHPFYFVSIFDTKETVPTLESGEVSFKDMWPQNWATYNLSDLSSKGEYKLKELKETPLRQLEYYVKLLRDNPELLNGNFRKYSVLYKLFRKFLMTCCHLTRR